MFYIADLHLHSHYSRATSKDLNLESLYQWARIKGINLIGTGDFTHPAWFKEIKEKLEPDGHGFYKLKNPPKDPAIPGLKVHDIDVRFCLTVEISSIYKYGERVRKNHNCVYAPDFETVARINAKLASIGNLEADGRPILGLPSRDLLEIVLESSPDAHLIPAHVWTPWFSTLGSKAGYDSIKECFRDLSNHIFALETGLSSDPEMNWKLSMLDRYTLVSNSDAHSPQKLGREANLFNTELSYRGMFDALKNHQGFLGTYEFFPEEGKYHHDGHRKCGISLEPEESLKYNNLCPVCGKPLTVGVLHRVEKLADRKKPERPAGAPDFHYIIPLPEILAEIKGVGPASKKVQQAFQQTISAFGNEFSLLKQVPIQDIEKQSGPVIAEAIRRMREQEVNPQAGYDGLYGTIKIFEEGEISRLMGQGTFFGNELIEKITKRELKETSAYQQDNMLAQVAEPQKVRLNEEQEKVKDALAGATLVTAGPGTGKTSTLIRWIENQIVSASIKPSEILAVTFTNKAADELKERLTHRLGDKVRPMIIGTFHAIGWQILKERWPELTTIYDEESREVVLRLIYPELEDKELKKLAKALVAYFELADNSGFEAVEFKAATYRDYLHKRGAVDLSDIISQVIELWQREPEWLERARKQWQAIAVDEFQDINPLQYQFIKLIGLDKNLLAIGDPDQAIYGFRGSDVRLFFRFKEEFKAREIGLLRNYRSTQSIVEAAGSIIQNNTLKSGIELIPNKPQGKRIKVFEAANTLEEAYYIAGEIEKYIGGTENLTIGTPSDTGDYAFSDIAVLFRTRKVGSELLNQLKKKGIPAHFGDGTSFLASPPFSIIADTLRLYLNPRDMVALNGLLTNGLGWSANETRNVLRLIHQSQGNWQKTFATTLSEPLQQNWGKWRKFYKKLPAAFQKKGLKGAITSICDTYLPQDQLSDEELLKKEAILELAADAQADLESFLEKMTLNPYTDTGRLKTEGVHLLTFHAAKGLEFPIVFIAGAEERVTPIRRKDADIEEERRLFYVALTRAKEEAQIIHCRERMQYQQLQSMEASRFLYEIPGSLKQTVQLIQKKSAAELEKEQLKLF